jgi:hypothetical protein
MVAVGFLLVKKITHPSSVKMNYKLFVSFYARVRVPNAQAGCQNKEYHLQNSSIVLLVIYSLGKITIVNTRQRRY